MDFSSVTAAITGIKSASDIAKLIKENAALSVHLNCLKEGCDIRP